MVDCIGLENRRTERYRGFESLSLRSLNAELFKPSVFLSAVENRSSNPRLAVPSRADSPTASARPAGLALVER